MTGETLTSQSPTLWTDVLHKARPLQPSKTVPPAGNWAVKCLNLWGHSHLNHHIKNLLIKSNIRQSRDMVENKDLKFRTDLSWRASPKQNIEQNRGVHSRVAKLCASMVPVSENLSLAMFHPTNPISPYLLSWAWLVFLPACTVWNVSFGRSQHTIPLNNVWSSFENQHIVPAQFGSPCVNNFPCSMFHHVDAWQSVACSQRGCFQGRAKQEGVAVTASLFSCQLR